MGYCTNCGQELGDGRFCTRCGSPVGAPPPPPSTPPAPHAGQVPPSPRFPLFADEAAPAPYPAPEPPTAPLPPLAPPPPTAPPPPPPHRRPRPVWPFAVAAAALLLVVGVLAGVLVLSDDGSSGPNASAPGQAHSGSPSSPAGGSLASSATVAVPATAPPNQDVNGKRTTYAGANMLDGVPETCWRMPGDGTGDQVTVTLADATHLQRVGMINGYAKIAQDAQGHELDWYHGNRRVLRVEWVFDDGTVVPQDLSDTEAVQWVDVDVTTTRIVLRLVDVSSPGTGRAARDYTAISDLSFVAG